MYIGVQQSENSGPLTQMVALAPRNDRSVTAQAKASGVIRWLSRSANEAYHQLCITGKTHPATWIFPAGVEYC